MCRDSNSWGVAQAEAALAKRDVQRDVAEAERELVTARAALKREEQKCRELAAASAVQAALREEAARTASELSLQVAALEGERSNLFERTVARSERERVDNSRPWARPSCSFFFFSPDLFFLVQLLKIYSYTYLASNKLTL